MVDYLFSAAPPGDLRVTSVTHTELRRKYPLSGILACHFLTSCAKAIATNCRGGDHETRKN